MNIETKFNVGDWVYIKQQINRYNELYKPVLDKNQEKRDYISLGDLETISQKPGKFKVIEIMTQQCYAGIQVHYVLRAVNDDRLIKYTEPELTSSGKGEE